MSPQEETERPWYDACQSLNDCWGNCSACKEKTAEEELRLAKADYKLALEEERLAREDIERSKKEKRKSLRQPTTP